MPGPILTAPTLGFDTDAPPTIISSGIMAAPALVDGLIQGGTLNEIDNARLIAAGKEDTSGCFDPANILFSFGVFSPLRVYQHH
jgi:hypothetical protein